MLTISYAISSFLLRYSQKTEHFRREILLHPLSPKDELLFRFNATVTKIYFGLALSGYSTTSQDVRKILENQILFTDKKKLSKNKLDEEIKNYKKALDYIKQEWLVSTMPIEPKTLMTLYAFLSKEKFKIQQQKLQEVINYLQVSSDDPFIQAALAKFLFQTLDESMDKNESFSTLCSYLFLYKNGFDCRGILVLEEAWGQNKNLYNNQYKTALEQKNITAFLEYLVKAMSLQLERSYLDIKKTSLLPYSENEKNLELNTRQKAILSLLDVPNTVITNKTVQKAFNISQITASRDLAKLTTLGLLFVHGKGRSVRYTRV